MSVVPVPLRRNTPAPPGQGIDPALHRVEGLMIHLAAGDRLDRCGGMAIEHLCTGGKRLRARLALRAAEALGLDPEAVSGWAAAVELLHNASLVHDDLQDGDKVRRGRPTTWVRYGAAQAINVGDLMLVLPQLALDAIDTTDAIRWALSRMLAQGAAATVRGQSLEMGLLASRRLERADYEAAARGKSGAFFALPVHGALILAGVDRATAASLARHFETLGLLYQLADDVLDLYGDKERAGGADLREGKVTGLVATHLELYPADRDWLVGELEADRDASADEVAAVASRFRHGGALEEVLDWICALSRSVFDAEDLAAHPGLHRVAAALVQRTLAPIRHLDPSLPVGPEVP